MRLARKVVAFILYMLAGISLLPALGLVWLAIRVGLHSGYRQVGAIETLRYLLSDGPTTGP